MTGSIAADALGGPFFIILPISALITWEIVGFSKKAKATDHEKKAS